MLVFLDTKDLIDLLEHSRPCVVNTFEQALRKGGHELVISWTNVHEISRPLVEGNTKTLVTKLLNRIEELPIRYIREGTLPREELREAITAFREKREYRQVSPFVKRFDEACTPEGTPATSIYLNFGLADTVFTLYATDPSVLRQPSRHGNALRRLFSSDRAMKDPPSLAEHFVETVRKHLLHWRLPARAEDLGVFARWIYENPSRCPSIRLAYEVFHALRINIGDTPKDGDIPDFANLGCTPYVDVITLDGRIRDYVRRVSSRIMPGCANRVCKNLEEVLQRI